MASNVDIGLCTRHFRLHKHTKESMTEGYYLIRTGEPGIVNVADKQELVELAALIERAFEEGMT